MAPQIQTGIAAWLTTRLLFASTKSASASRRKRVSMSAALVGESTTSDWEKSNSRSGSDKAASGVSDGMLEGTREESVGAMVE